jgi:hypothetical protein
VFPPGHLVDALEFFAELGSDCGAIDLHDGLPDLDDRPWGEVWARSRRVALGQTWVRILGAEDQLRQQCLHMLRHGAWRPLWLCDVGASLEAAGPDFDTAYCLAGARIPTEWVQALIGIASELLDTRRDVLSVGPPPRWLLNAVLAQWATGICGDSHCRDPRPILQHALHPLCWGTALRSRWPNPIEAAGAMRQSPRSRLPRRLLQGLVVLRRAAGLLWRLPAAISPPTASLAASIHVS